MYRYSDLKEGILLKRYKRFLTDIQFEGKIVTAHNPNTGSMKSLLNNGKDPVGYPALISESDSKTRKLKYTLELINVKGEWIISNTLKVNHIVKHMFVNGKLHEILNTSGEVKSEVKYKDSRFDFYIEDSKPTFVEVKSVTYFDTESCYFPDAVTTRGTKQLHTLIDAMQNGYRCIILYVCMVKRKNFDSAAHIDPEYAETIEKAKQKGLEVRKVYANFDKNSLSVNLEKY